jgi:hypothetical protein
MPYIKQERRERFDNLINVLVSEIHQGDEPNGEVNYIITRIAYRGLNPSEPSKLPISRYKDITKVISAFECAKLEFYRRAASKLEDRAINRNGDIKEYE